MRKKGDLFRRKKKTMFRGVVASVSEARNEGNSENILSLGCYCAKYEAIVCRTGAGFPFVGVEHLAEMGFGFSGKGRIFGRRGLDPLWRRWRKTVRPCAGSRGKSAAAIPCRPNNPGKSPYFICWRRSVPTIRCSDTSLTPGSITAGREIPGRVVLCPNPVAGQPPRRISTFEHSLQPHHGGCTPRIPALCRTCGSTLRHRLFDRAGFSSPRKIPSGFPAVRLPGTGPGGPKTKRWGQ